MSKVNENFLKLKNNYLFVTITEKVKEFEKNNPEKEIIKLGIGDVTKPLAPIVIDTMKRAVDEMGSSRTFKGYGPETGYNFLKKKIVKDYKEKNIDFGEEEVFISDGIAADIGNMSELFSEDNLVALTDPVYPEYLDTSIFAGRTGKFNEQTGKYDGIIYLPCTAENNFDPELPKEKVDIIYLCLPNNPTGTTLNKKQLEKWIKYAKENNSIIMFDAAYEVFISEDNVPRSIYEIEGAKEVAIEFKTYSKIAGFTGVRCGYCIVPKELKTYTKNNEEVNLNKLWNRRQSTKTNGVSYITQRGAEAIYSEEGKREIKKNIEYYKENAKIIKQGLEEAGFTTYGGINAPYVWMKTPNNMKSWEFFDLLLNEVGVVGTPGVGFGPSGEGYFRLSAFGNKEDTIKAMKKIKEWKRD